MYLDFLFSLNFSEIFFFIILFIISIWDIGKNYFDKNWINSFKPTTFFGLLIIFYCLIGPLSTAQGDGSIMYREVDHRQFYEIGLFSALLSYLSFIIGFHSKNNFKIKKFGINKFKEYRLKTKDFLFIHKWGERIILFALIMQFVIYGADLVLKITSTNDSINTQGYQGFASNLVASTVNFLIIGLVLLFITLLNGIKERTKFIFYFTITIGLFLNLGFRYRLFLLFLPLILVYFFYKKIKPSIRFLLTLLLSTLLAFGFIQIAREYGKGLSFESYQKKLLDSRESFFEFVIKSAFVDTNVFHTSAGIIYKTPKDYNFVGLRPVINAVSVPIPRTLWKGKPSGQYLANIYKNIYDGYLWEVGAANLGFAEYYLAGGWIALIAINFFLGLFFKKIWFEFLINFCDPIAQIKYSLYLSFLYILFSRGYLLQLTYIYASIFIPLYYFSKIWNKRFR